MVLLFGESTVVGIVSFILGLFVVIIFYYATEKGWLDTIVKRIDKARGYKEKKKKLKLKPKQETTEEKTLDVRITKLEENLSEDKK